MLLTKVGLENIKGIRSLTTIEFKPITLLFGRNSSGKSTILQSLLYAREVLERSNVDADRTIGGGDSVDLGGFRNLVYAHDVRHSIGMTFVLDITTEDLPEYFDSDLWQPERYELVEAIESVRSAQVELIISWSYSRLLPFVSTYGIEINGEPFARITSSDDGKQVLLSYLNFEHSLLATKDVSTAVRPSASILDFVRNRTNEVGAGEGNDLQIALANQGSAVPKFGQSLELDQARLWGDDPQLEDYHFNYLLSRLVVGPGEALLRELGRVRYIGPLRSMPQRNLRPTSTPDESRWSSGSAAWNVLLNCDQKTLDSINSWLNGEMRLNAGYSVQLKSFKELDISGPIYVSLMAGRGLDDSDFIQEELQSLTTVKRIVLVENDTGIEVQPQDIGIGISQVLPIVVAAVHSKARLVAIEQPELHVHPALQVALGDLLVSQATEKDTQFLIETHSDHILLRLLRRIRETNGNELPPRVTALTIDQMAIYYFESDEDGIHVRRLEITQEGDSRGDWPHGFFEEREGELFD